LAKDWKALTAEERDTYPGLGKRGRDVEERRLGDDIVPQQEAWLRRKEQVMNNMQNLVFSVAFINW
jgi:hypothetical protein